MKMKKLLALVLALAAMAMITIASRAQEAEGRKAVPIQKVPTLVCCKCLGEVTSLNINTGQGAPIDPLWRVNGGPAFTTAPFSSWINLSPAKWIQPVANPKPSTNVPPGVYKYTMKFNIPKCIIPGTTRLVGKFAADNTVKAFLDGTPIPGASCTSTIYCFKAPAAPIPLNLANIAPGSHLLTFEVNNESGPSGLIVNAQIVRQCRKEGLLDDKAQNVEEKAQ